MSSTPTIRIGHLYPRRMNIYGDRGNIITLARRAEWRGWKVDITPIETGERGSLKGFDLFFFGGGQDQEQESVSRDLQKRATAVRSAIAGGAAVLAVCGGYQLLGKYYQPAEGKRLPGLGIFDAYTVAGPKRLIGNVVADPAAGGLASPIVGFENHSGLTYLGKTASPFAHIRHGHGNNGRDHTEGCLTKTAIGTYLHGSLLPKNPEVADWLLATALRRRRQDVPLTPLGDRFERIANQTVTEAFA